MNIITKSDVKKFIALLKAGIKKGFRKEMTSYSSSLNEGEFFISLTFNFSIKSKDVEHIVSDDAIENEIDELLG